MQLRRPPRWWPLALSAVTLLVSVGILITSWDVVFAGHPAYPTTLRLVAAGSFLVGVWSVLARRPRNPEAGPAESGAPDPVEASDEVVGVDDEGSARPRPRWRRVAVRVVQVVAVLALVTVLLYLRPHGASTAAIDAMAGTPGVTVTDSSTRIRLDPTGGAQPTGVVFYPGALVDPRAYVPNLTPLAEAGYPVVIIKEPFSLAVLDPNGADAVMDADPDVDRWVVGGHSLGGVMAASVAGRDDPRVRGLLLWGSYPNGSISDRTELDVTSIYGSEDGLTTPAEIEDTSDRLPPGTTFVEVVGGNHAFFGDYGTQSGDGTATVAREEAQRQIRAASLELVDRVAAAP